MPKSKRLDDAITFGQRLTEMLKESDISRHGAGAYLGRKYGASIVTGNDWLNGKFLPEPDVARRIAEDHGWTFERLYFGAKAKSANPSRYRIAEAGPEDPAMPIEFVDVRGSCGGGAIAWDESLREPLYREPGWFRRYKVRPEDALAIWADGDSMADFIIDGDIVIFDRSKRTARSGQIFLIEHPDGLKIKRLRRDIDGSWVLESNNPDKRRFPDEKIGPEQLELLTIKGEFIYRQGG